MNSNFSGGRTKIKWRGDMLLAWFAQATPPVLWRWQASNVSAGFGLKKEDGRIELVKHEATTGSTVIAAFADEGHAQAALAQLSETVMEGNRRTLFTNSAGRSWLGLIWKWLSSILLALLLLYYAYAARRVLVFLNDPVGSVMKMTNHTASAEHPQASQAAPSQAAPSQAAPSQQPREVQLPGQLGSTPRPMTPTPQLGKPVDADALFH